MKFILSIFIFSPLLICTTFFADIISDIIFGSLPSLYVFFISLLIFLLIVPFISRRYLKEVFLSQAIYKFFATLGISIILLPVFLFLAFVTQTSIICSPPDTFVVYDYPSGYDLNDKIEEEDFKQFLFEKDYNLSMIEPIGMVTGEKTEFSFLKTSIPIRVSLQKKGKWPPYQVSHETLYISIKGATRQESKIIFNRIIKELNEDLDIDLSPTKFQYSNQGCL